MGMNYIEILRGIVARHTLSLEEWQAIEHSIELNKYDVWTRNADKQPDISDVYQVTVEGVVGEFHVEERYFSALRGWNTGSRRVLAWRNKQDDEPYIEHDESVISLGSQK